MAPSAGTRLGPYDILSQLGEGGMGVVFRARDTKLERDVALKVLPKNLAEDPDALSRFEREAKAVAALSHPNILAIHDLCREEGTVFAVMELLEGETLRQRLQEGALPVQKAVEIALEIAAGLAAAHEKGIIHRDLKPENVFVTLDGRTKILDFGLALATAVGVPEAKTVTRHTLPGAILGTAGYMSPEQVRALPVDARSDIFSFGAIAYEMLSGERAFRGESSVETLNAILKQGPPSLLESTKNVSPTLDRIVRRCLEKRPEDRFRSAHDLALALDAISASSSRSLKAPGARAEAHGTRSRRLLERVGLLLAGLVLGAGGTLVWGRLLSPQASGVAPASLGGGLAAFRWITFSGHDSSPTVSPDGRTIAFTSDRDAQPRIWLKQVSGEGEAPLTTGPDDCARFSPDGTQVLFVRPDGARTSLYRAAVLGGEARRVLEDASEGDWSPDGKQIAFLRLRREGDLTVTVLGVAATDGSGAREVARISGGMRTPRWSPDGGTIVVVPAWGALLVGAQQGPVLVSLGDGSVRTLPAPDTRRNISAAAWTASGEVVYLQTEGAATAAGGAAILVRQDTGTGRICGRNWSPSSAVTLDILSDGRVVFDTRSSRQNLREVGLGPGGAANGRWLSRGESTDRQPVYSPDGEWVAFSSNRGGGMNLWLVSSSTGNLRRVTDSHTNWDPAFTPDGRRLLWSSNRGGNFEVWTADTDGGTPRQVTADGVNAENPTASPDGQWIVYSSGHPEKAGLWKVHPDGTGAVQLVKGRTTLPEVSPDGRHVLYRLFAGRYPAVLRVVRLQDGRAEPFEIEIEARRRTTVTLGRARWMPDGRSIAFLGQDEAGASGVFVQDFAPGRNTNASRRKLAGFEPEVAAESFGISPDAKHLALAGWVQLFSLMEGEGLAGLLAPPRGARPDRR